MKYLSNAFSLQMVEPGSTIYTKEISVEGFKKILQRVKIKSIIGHADTARFLSDLLGSEIKHNREAISLTPNDRLYVAQITGGRLPEGATILPDGVELKILLVFIEQNRTVEKYWTDGSIYGAIEKRARMLANEFGGEIKYMQDSWGNLHIDVVGRGFYASLHDD